MSSPRKAAGYLQSLQQALQHERYNEVPELSRKVRKHDEKRTCFARSAEVQASLEKRVRSAQVSVDNANLNDLTGKFHWLQINVDQLSEEKALLKEAYAAHNSATAEDRTFYDVTNFFYGLVTRQLDATTSLKAQVSTHPHNPFLSQSLALRGILEELHGRPQEALREYEAYPYPDLDSATVESTIWLEHIKYRIAILSPSPNNSRAFSTFSSKHSSKAQGKLLHVLSTQKEDPEYAHELLKRTQFPSADSTNTRLLNLVSSKLDLWIAHGSDPLAAEKHLELLYEAGSKTFHSPRILRYLIMVLTALQRYDEALLALDAYLQIAVHAQKTQPGTDVDNMVDIISTIRFVVVRLLKHLPLDHEPEAKGRNLYTRTCKILRDLKPEDPKCTAMLEEIHGSVRVLEYRANGDQALLIQAIEVLTLKEGLSRSINSDIVLALAQVQQGELVAAMTSIHSALRTNDTNMSALLFFANLLCCEELYDRALQVLDRIFLSSKTTNLWQGRVACLLAKLMQVKIIELTKGAEAALQESSQLLAAYRQYLDPITSDRHVIIHESDPRVGRKPQSTTNNTSEDSITPHAPSISVQPPFESPQSTILAPATNPSSTMNEIESRSAPNMNHEKLRSASGPARSSSLKVSHSAKSLGQHLHLRKTASVRSMRGNDFVENSSRSSSPLNHPAPSIRSILPDVATNGHQEIELDRQLTASELQEQKRKELLAEIWLYIAHLCRASNTPSTEIEQAIQEAIHLIGSTPAIMSTQLEIRLQLARAQGPLTNDDMDVIEQGYDYALNLDDTDATTILSFSQFLLEARPISPDEYDLETRRGRIARAYEMLEYLKTSPAASHPKVWHLSAEIALERGEEDQAEEDSWRAIQTSDTAGVVDWFRLWQLE